MKTKRRTFLKLLTGSVAIGTFPISLNSAKLNQGHIIDEPMKTLVFANHVSPKDCSPGDLVNGKELRMIGAAVGEYKLAGSWQLLGKDLWRRVA